MRQVHHGGDKLFVDYAGQKPSFIDPATGERISVELFVAVLGASNYTYAEATLTQQVPDWIASHQRAFAFIGGVTAALVWWLGHFPARAQEDFFAAGPDTLASTCLNPMGGKAEPASGGFRVSGRWSFSSGCDAAAWAMVAVPGAGPNTLRWLLVPRPDYEILDHVVRLGHAGDGEQGHRDQGGVRSRPPRPRSGPRRRSRPDRMGSFTSAPAIAYR